METRAHYVLVGAFTLIIVLAGAGFALWLAKQAGDREFSYYDVVFEEAVTGLSRGGAVHYNGIQVGEVSRLRLAPDDPSRVLARVRLDASTPVKADTGAKLGFFGLTGVAYIQLTGGGADSPMLRDTVPEGEVPRVIAHDSDLQRLFTSSEDIVTNVNDLMIRLSETLNRDTMDKIGRTLGHIETVSAAVAGNSEDISALIRSTAQASAKLNSTLERADRLLAEMESATASVRSLLDVQMPDLSGTAQSALESLDKLVHQSNDLVAANRAAIDRFAQQGLGQANIALGELKRLMRSLNRIAEELEEDPARFILGSDQPEEFEAR